MERGPVFPAEEGDEIRIVWAKGINYELWVVGEQWGNYPYQSTGVKEGA